MTGYASNLGHVSRGEASLTRVDLEWFGEGLALPAVNQRRFARLLALGPRLGRPALLLLATVSGLLCFTLVGGTQPSAMGRGWILAATAVGLPPLALATWLRTRFWNPRLSLLVAATNLVLLLALVTIKPETTLSGVNSRGLWWAADIARGCGQGDSPTLRHSHELARGAAQRLLAGRSNVF